MQAHDLEDLKNQFYNWCGLLSIREIAQNKVLLSVIEKIEPTLISLTLDLKKETQVEEKRNG